MRNNQFGRRNLLPYIRTKLALELEETIAARAKGNQGARTDIPQISAKSIQPIDTRAELAARLRPFYDEQAKERQGARTDLMPDIVEKIPQGQSQRLDAGQRAVVAAELRPFYAEQAKARQLASLKQNAKESTVVEKVPQRAEGAKARDEAGKAAGVNGKYIDIARKVRTASPEVANQVLNGKMTLQEGLKQVAPIIAAAKAVTLAPLHLTFGTSFGTCPKIGGFIHRGTPKR